MAAKAKNKTWIIVAVAAIVALAAYFIFHRSGPKNQFVTVTRGDIVESVSVTGSTTPLHSVDLAFENGGTIARVNDDVGARVKAGDVIVELDTRDLEAQRAQAQAGVDTQRAKLQSLQAGAQPADIRASEAALQGGMQTLANLYTNVGTTLSNGYAKANDAIRNQLTNFFSNPESSNPQLSFSVNDSGTANEAASERLSTTAELNQWQTELANITPSTPSSTLDSFLVSGNAHLALIGKLLTTVSQAVVQAVNVPPSTIADYKTKITNAVTEVNSGSSDINTLMQNIASQKINISQLQAELDLKRAGATSGDIAAQQAQVEQAQANLASIEVKIAKASLVSPIDGVINVQNAKKGQIAAPNAIMTSVISDTNEEIDSDVPETDIGKIKQGDPVQITFDAFPAEKFSGKVFFIDPAQTVIQGVVDYRVKVALDNPDSRIRSGLTANLAIETEKKQNTLIVPQFAVLQNDQGSFVEVLENGSTVEKPVTLGLRDQNGNIEIVSGVTEGEQILNIGLKTQ